MFKKFKTKINIMGRDISVVLYKDEEVFKQDLEMNELPPNVAGYADYSKKTISVMIHTMGGNLDMESTEIVLWHEIGHFMERYAVSSTIGGEWAASLLEFIPPLIPQVNKILKELKDKVGKYGKKN